MLCSNICNLHHQYLSLLHIQVITTNKCRQLWPFGPLKVLQIFSSAFYFVEETEVEEVDSLVL